VGGGVGTRSEVFVFRKGGLSYEGRPSFDAWKQKKFIKSGGEEGGQVPTISPLNLNRSRLASLAETKGPRPRSNPDLYSQSKSGTERGLPSCVMKEGVLSNKGQVDNN